MKKIKKSLKEVKKILKPQETVSLLFLFIFLFSGLGGFLTDKVGANIEVEGILVEVLASGGHSKNVSVQLLKDGNPVSDSKHQPIKDKTWYNFGTPTDTWNYSEDISDINDNDGFSVRITSFTPFDGQQGEQKVYRVFITIYTNDNSSTTKEAKCITGDSSPSETWSNNHHAVDSNENTASNTGNSGRILDLGCFGFNIQLPVQKYELTVTSSSGGTATDETNDSPYEVGSSVSIKAEASPGYQFVDWTASAGTFDNVNATETIYTMPAQNATVTANFIEVIEVYTVTFFIDEGEIHTTTTVEHGATTTLPADPEKEGNTFEGWEHCYQNEIKVCEPFSEEIIIIEDMDVYAAWKQKVIEKDPEEEPTTPTTVVRRSGGGYTAPSEPEPEGEVLGEEIMAECGIYLFEYIKEGADNNPIEVQKLQTFLNQHMGESLPVTGFYGSASREALNRFQLKYKEEVLQPWVDAGVHCDVNQPTGYVYKTTQRWINLIMCPTLDLPMPDLSSYPETDCTGYLGQVLGEEIEWVDEEVTEEEPLLEEEPEVLDEPELPLEEVVEETEEEEESFMAIWLLLLALVVILILAFYFLKKPKKA